MGLIESISAKDSSYLISQYHRDIAAKLEEINPDESKNIIITLPIEACFISEHFPAWYLSKFDDTAFIHVSKTGKEAVHLKEKFSDYMYFHSISPGRAICGRGFKILILDDPIDYSKSKSSNYLNHEKEWFNHLIYDRACPNASIICFASKESEIVKYLLNTMPEYNWDLLEIK